MAHNKRDFREMRRLRDFSLDTPRALLGESQCLLFNDLCSSASFSAILGHY